MPAGPSCRGSPSDSVGTHVRTSSQALRPAAPSSLLHFLLGLCMERVQRLHPPGAAPFVPNDSQSLACYFSPHEACGVCVLRREDSTSQGGRGPSSKFAACYHSAEQRRQQILLALPLMAVIRKISRVWSLLGCGAAISYIITASSRGASIFRILSNRHVEGGFSTRLCSHVLSLLGYKGRSFARLAEFIDLVSTFFRHAGSSLKSASDILSKVNEYQGSNSVRPRISHESASSSTDSNEVACLETIGTVINNRDSHGGHPGVQQKVISTMGEGNKVISQWKEEGSQISVDVPPNMSVKSALELKKQFEREDADRLLQGATIKSILDKASAKSDLDATQRDEELQGR